MPMFTVMSIQSISREVAVLRSLTIAMFAGAVCVGQACAAPDRSALSQPSLAPQGAELQAAPLASTANVRVSVGGDLTKEVAKLGERDVREQAEELADVIQMELNRMDSQWTNSQVNLVITDLKPNRPTLQQAIDRPGLSIFDSISIGGATIEGELVTADGQTLPIRYARYSSHLDEVFGFNTWGDADRAFDGLASNLRRGRLVTR